MADYNSAHTGAQIDEAIAAVLEKAGTWDGKLSPEDIINTLLSDATDKPLSAAQGKALKALIDALTAADVGAVPTTRTVNGKALSANITLSAADVGARASSWTPTADEVGAEPAFTTLSVSKGGTGYTSLADSTYTTARYRGSALVSADTTPTVNGVINWTYS